MRRFLFKIFKSYNVDPLFIYHISLLCDVVTWTTSYFHMRIDYIFTQHQVSSISEELSSYSHRGQSLNLYHIIGTWLLVIHFYDVQDLTMHPFHRFFLLSSPSHSPFQAMLWFYELQDFLAINQIIFYEHISVNETCHHFVMIVKPWVVPPSAY